MDHALVLVLVLDNMEPELKAHKLVLEELLPNRGWIDHNMEKELTEGRMKHDIAKE